MFFSTQTTHAHSAHCAHIRSQRATAGRPARGGSGTISELPLQLPIGTPDRLCAPDQNLEVFESLSGARGLRRWDGQQEPQGPGNLEAERGARCVRHRPPAEVCAQQLPAACTMVSTVPSVSPLRCACCLPRPYLERHGGAALTAASRDATCKSAVALNQLNRCARTGAGTWVAAGEGWTTDKHGNVRIFNGVDKDVFVRLRLPLATHTHTHPLQLAPPPHPPTPTPMPQILSGTRTPGLTHPVTQSLTQTHTHTHSSQTCRAAPVACPLQH